MQREAARTFEKVLLLGILILISGVLWAGGASQTQSAVPAAAVGSNFNPTGYQIVNLVKPMIKVAAMPMLSFTPAEQEELNPINSDIITYIRESQVQFVTGRLPLSQWDTYVRNVRNMGADRYVALYQASWDRWSKK